MDNSQYFALAEKYLPGRGIGGYILPDDVRFVYSHGKGCYFWDADGKEYVDFVCGAGALILGHSPDCVVDAIRLGAGSRLHMFGVLNTDAVLFAERLCVDIPCAEKIAYVTTGSEATAFAMRMARAYTGRDKIIKFEGGYHGNHDYGMVSAFPRSLGNYPQGVADGAGQPQATSSTMLVCPYNDEMALRSILEQHKGEVAAVIIEAVQRIIAAKPEFLSAVRDLTREFDVLMIMDEVVTGFRLAYGGAQSVYGIIPDLACYGKIVGGGGALAVIAGRGEIISLTNPDLRDEQAYAYLNGTLHGNPLTCSMAMALLDELKQPNFYEHLNSYAEDFCAEANDILSRAGCVTRLYRCGSLWQILGMDKPPENHADIMRSDMLTAKRLDHLLFQRGHYILPGMRRFFSAKHDDKVRQKFMQDLEWACTQL